MYVYEQLKNLRKRAKLTLQNLSDKVAYGTGNLSSYETGKLRAKDPTLIRILTRGYDVTKEEALNMIALWRREEIETKYSLSVAQDTESYNSDSPKTLEEYLKNEGLAPMEVLKIVEDVNNLKKSKKK